MPTLHRLIGYRASRTSYIFTAPAALRYRRHGG
jgi:hypothetical protein